MGNSIGIKITSIKENSFLKKIKFGNNPSFSILPYIYYISKINDISIDSDIKHEFIEKFTLRNIYTEKEYDINIEEKKSEDFSKEFTFIIEDFPKINHVLILSSIKENSISEKCNLKQEKTILLGNKKKYFQSINDVIESINNNNKQFIFFNYIEDIVFEIDFKEKFEEFNFQNKEELGFECQEISIEYFMKFYFESEWGRDQMNKYKKENNFISENNNKEEMGNKKENISIEKKDIENDINKNENMNKKKVEKDNKENNIQNDKENNEKNNKESNNDNNFKKENIENNNNKETNINKEKNENNINTENIINNNNNEINNNNEKKERNINKENNDSSNNNEINNNKENNEIISKKGKTENEVNQENYDDNTIMKESNKVIYINDEEKIEENINKNNIIKENDNNVKENNKNKNEKIKESDFKVKEKYKKRFPIYSQIDSNFRFIHKDKNNSLNIDTRDKIIIDSINLKECKITGYDIYSCLIEI